jgi:hypothetical protein
LPDTTFCFEHTSNKTNFINISSPDGSKEPTLLQIKKKENKKSPEGNSGADSNRAKTKRKTTNPKGNKKMVQETLIATLSTVASRLQNRWKKSKEIITDDGSPRKKPKLLSIPKQESKQECMDSSIKKANVDKWIGIPKFVFIKLFPLFQDHIQVTKDIQNICFRVVNNEGTGNCFYESILASNVFWKKFPKFKDNHHMLRVKLQNHAVCNPGLAREFYQLYATLEEN